MEEWETKKTRGGVYEMRGWHDLKSKKKAVKRFYYTPKV